MKQKAFSNSLNNQNKMGKLNNSFSTEYGDYFDDIHSEFAEEMMRTKSVKQKKEKNVNIQNASQRNAKKNVN